MCDCRSLPPATDPKEPRCWMDSPPTCGFYTNTIWSVIFLFIYSGIETIVPAYLVLRPRDCSCHLEEGVTWVQIAV